MIATIKAKSECLGSMHLVVVYLITKRWAVKMEQSNGEFPEVETPDHPWQLIATFPTEAEAEYCKKNLAHLWENMIHVDCQIHD